MRAGFRLLGLAVALLAIMGTDAGAQMFGDRTLGRIAPPRGGSAFGGLGAFGSRQAGGNRGSSGAGRSSRSGQSSGSAAEMFGFGAVSERHTRGGREAGDFVGTDARDIRGFVGMQQAENTGQVESAVSDLQVETGPDANRTGAASARTRTRMYRPRLKVDFGFTPPRAAEASSELTRRLESTLRREGNGSIEVSKEGRTAILRGEAASERDRRLARLLLLLEPGISNVEDRLTVGPARPSPEGPPSGEPARSTPENRPSVNPAALPENQP